MEFKTKEFTVLTPFSVVNKDEAAISDKTSESTLKLAGMANFCGADDYGKTYVDLVGDVVVPSGVDTSVWSVNPQILWQHERDETIGEGLLLEKRPDGLYIECVIHKGAMDEKDWYRVKSGLVHMFSIGFRTIDAEFKTIDDEDVYFILKSLLLEISIVSIPANSKSGFSQIKSFGEFFTSSKEVITSDDEKGLSTTSDKEEPIMNIKVKRSDLLTEKELETFKELGGDIETEVEVSLAKFIKDSVAQAIADAFAEKEAKEVAEAEVKAAEEAARLETERLELEAKAAEEAAALESAKLEEEKELADEVVELKSLVETLKAALAAEQA